MNNPRGRWMAAGLLAALCIGCLGALFGGTREAGYRFLWAAALAALTVLGGRCLNLPDRRERRCFMALGALMAGLVQSPASAPFALVVTLAATICALAVNEDISLWAAAPGLIAGVAAFALPAPARRAASRWTNCCRRPTRSRARRRR